MCVSLPVAGITSRDIKSCFGGFVGIEYEYSESMTIGGKLSGERCKKSGGGDTSKYGVMGLPKRS